MGVYWTVWITIILLALLIKGRDFAYTGVLTRQRCNHSEFAKTIFIIASMILIFIAGCRYYVGADFGGYYNYSRYLDFIPALKKLDEPGIRLIYLVASKIHPTGQFCVFCVAAVTLILQLSTIYKNTDNLTLALMLFVFMCWTACFNGVRQCLAVAVLFCGFPALRDKKFRSYAVIVLLAFLCHRSAIVMILVYFIVHREVTARNLLLLTVACIIVLKSYDKVYAVMNIVMDNAVEGTEVYWSTEVNRFRIASRIAPTIFFVYVYRNYRKTPIESFYINLLVVHAVVGLTTANSACLARMGLYTAPFALLAIVELIKIFPRNNLYSKLIVLMYWIMAWYECGKKDVVVFDLRWIW